MPKRETHLVLLGILFCAFLVRIFPLTVNRGEIDSVFSADSQLYWDLATNVAQYGEFVREHDRYTIERIENPWPTEIFRTPGYPYFLAALFTLGIQSVSALIIIQIGLDLSIVFLTYVFATLVMSSRVGRTAALLIAFDMTHIVQANMVMSDILFALCMLLSYIQVVQVKAQSRWQAFLLLGFTLAVAGTIRPVGLIVSFLFAGFVYLRTKALVLSSMLLAIGLAFPVFWTARNFYFTGQLTPSSALEYNLYLVTASKVKARAEGIPYVKAGEMLSQAMLSDLDKNGVADWKASLQRHGAPIFYQYPVETVVELGRAFCEMLLAGERRHLLRILNLPGGEADVTSLTEGRRKVAVAIADFLPARPLFEIVIVGLQALLNALILLLAWVGWRRIHDRYTRWFLLLILLYFVGSSIVVATARMRIPVTPIVALLAAAGAVNGRKLARDAGE